MLSCVKAALYMNVPEEDPSKVGSMAEPQGPVPCVSCASQCESASVNCFV